jgi:release factor glutamine methyltransferase
VSAPAGLTAGVSIAEAIRHMAQALRQAGIEDADIDARALTGHALQVDRAQLISNPERRLTAQEAATIAACAARRLTREPVARIVGRKEFWDQVLEVTPAVLVPRPETETVVEVALDHVVTHGLRLEALRILDIGTGTGALLLALLGELQNASGIGTDISAEAIEVAHGNAERNGLAARCGFVVCDIGAGVDGRFDLIVSNPPYIPHDDIATLAPEVRNYDPGLALDGGSDGLHLYRAIAQDAQRLLAPTGLLIVELGIGQEADVRALFTKAGFNVGEARADLGGIARALSASFAA